MSNSEYWGKQNSQTTMHITYMLFLIIPINSQGQLTMDKAHRYLANFLNLARQHFEKDKLIRYISIALYEGWCRLPHWPLGGAVQSLYSPQSSWVFTQKTAINIFNLTKSPTAEIFKKSTRERAMRGTQKWQQNSLKLDENNTLEFKQSIQTILFLSDSGFSFKI